MCRSAPNWHRTAAAIAAISMILTRLAGSCPADESDRLAARRLLLKGRYVEAIERYEQLAEGDPVAAALGLARCHRETGQRERAQQVLAAAAEKNPQEPELQAELARLAWERGDESGARTHARRALDADDEQLLARWILAERERLEGRLEAAQDAYAWFLDYDRRHREVAPEQQLWIGRALAQRARLRGESQRFHYLVDTLYPRVLESDPDCWPAHLEAARLYLEKYNAADAHAELAAALAINPNTAEVYAVQAQLALQSFNLPAADAAISRALAIDPQCLPAWHQRADRLLAELRLAEAAEVLQQARPINPRCEQTLGRLAAAWGAAGNPPPPCVAELIAEAAKRNPACGEFFLAIGDSLDRMRRYPQAAQFYRRAIERLPACAAARSQLGLTLLRLGEESEAATLLDEAFRADPFHVRVKNSLEVLDVLKGYATLETEHFVLRYDRERDELLARYAARYLEQEIYPEVVARLGYAPAGKSLFEIFSRARNSSGHAWFSARMAGLPFVGTIGACAGQVVAMVSPGEMGKKFHWERVLRHEFVHVVNLQQTDFGIPHWFTEGLAVWLEDLPRRPQWTEILVRRHASGRLFNLDSINFGFIRPQNQEDWTLAYCQAELYVLFLHDRFGPRAAAGLLDAYADQLATPEAIRRSLGVDQADFEREYAVYLEGVVRESGWAGPEPRAADVLLRALGQDRDNAGLWAELAQRYLQDGKPIESRQCASAALRRDSRQQRAALVLARLYAEVGQSAEAIAVLQAALDEQSPRPDALGMLGDLQFQAGDLAEAERLYQLGVSRFGGSERWPKSLARVYLKSGEQRKLRRMLAELADLDEDNPDPCRKLAQLAREAEDWDGVVRWADRVLRIEVGDAQAHALLAGGYLRLGRPGEAVEQYEVAMRLAPERADWQFALAQALVAAGEKSQAKTVLEDLRRRSPQPPEVQALWDQMQRDEPLPENKDKPARPQQP